MEDNIRHDILFSFGDTAEHPQPPAPQAHREPPPRRRPGLPPPDHMDPRNMRRRNPFRTYR